MRSLTDRQKLQKCQHRRTSALQAALIETLESRALLAGTSLTIAATDATASETDPLRSGRGQFVIQRPTGPITEPLTVKYTVTAASTATQGSDFYTLKGKVLIRAGARSALVNLYPRNDSLVEGDETVIIRIVNNTFPLVNRQTTITIQDNDPETASPPPGWWNTSWHFRTPISVNVGAFSRTDYPVQRPINFTTILSRLGRSGALIEESIRVIEYASDAKTVIDENVPFQFDKAAGYDAASNASGTLVFLVKGETAANAVRRYQVYFDTTGSFSAPTFTPLVRTTDNVTDEGFESVRIETPVATYFYQKAEGGFSSIVDVDGNDWVSWNSNSNPGSAGGFRGIPNMGPAGFHPGAGHDVTTEIVSRGPLRTVLESTDSDGNRVQWEFYPTFARQTVLSMNQPYYFLYEGTPGGGLDANDTVVLSDGSVHSIDETWSDTDGLGSDNGEEWVYFRDSDVGANGRYFYFVHNTPDQLEDSYFNLEDNMTVFGFGRHNNPGAPPDQLLTAVANVFTMGLSESGDGGADFAAASEMINGVYRPLSVTVGGSQALE
ncbi:hypothetical protein [Fontivita pretiosa]|uniref:hypothetical protein n=1 Tax=Fontivita pretiosa TaxID=2989684 RepID=UPI003D1694A0